MAVQKPKEVDSGLPAIDLCMAGRLAAARCEMPPLQHDSKNEHHKYPYTSSEKIIGNSSRLLARHGLSIIPIDSKLDIIPDGCKLEQTWMLVCHGSPSVQIRREFYAEARKGNALDKSLSAAMTLNYSYMLRDLMGIERPKSSHDEIAARDDTDYTPRKHRPSPPRRYANAASQLPAEEMPNRATSFDNGRHFKDSLQGAMKERGIPLDKAKLIAGAEAKARKLKDYASADANERERLVERVRSGFFDGFKTLNMGDDVDVTKPPVDIPPGRDVVDQHSQDESKCMELWMRLANVDGTTAMNEMNLAIQRTTRSTLTFAEMNAEQIHKWAETLEKFGDEYVEKWHAEFQRQKPVEIT